jgi:deoxyadenosine/deoxycytidine kinase
MNCNYGAIQDRTVYEDVEIFAKNLYKMNYISERDWKTYIGLFENMVQFLKEPDLFIYLKASTDTLLSRIKNRNRDFEKTISPEYLHSLNISYDKWIYGIDKNKVLIIDTDKFNIFKDIDKLNAIFTKIQAALD